MKRVTFISLALFFLLIASAETSFACSCLRNSKPLKTQVREAYARSTAIFSGEVVEIEESPTDKDGLIVKFKVAKSWKGQARQESTIKTYKESAMCGYSFTVGQKYLVYAYGAGDALYTDNCSRTAILGNRNDVKYLDQLRRKKTRPN